MYEQQKNQETFTPVINHRRGDNGERRNLNQFLNDQKNFSEKVQKKREDILNKNEEERNKENVGKPKVDKNSEELAKKLNCGGEEPTYLRLYKKRTVEKEKIAEKERLLKKHKTEEAKKR